jgi:uncharacterized membrane protein YphA (DoxX/SURF4 family)
MSSTQPTRRRSKSTEERPTEAGRLEVTVEEERSTTDSRLFTLGCVLLGAILAFMAVDNLRNLEQRVQYAEAKGAPLASLSVPAVSSSLFVGSIGLALWRAPAAATTAIAAFFVSTTPVIHDLSL